MSNLFTNEADFTRADWPLLQWGAVNLVHGPDTFVTAQESLSSLGYDVAVVTCREGEAIFQEQMAMAMHWHRFSHAGWNGNLNALDDALYDYPFGPSGRSVLALDGFHCLVQMDAQTAQVILDHFELVSRNYLLAGKLLIALVQTDDTGYRCQTHAYRWAHVLR